MSMWVSAEPVYRYLLAPSVGEKDRVTWANQVKRHVEYRDPDAQAYNA